MTTIHTPVFILGLHRSGTTLLYNLMAESSYWNTVSAWHVIRFDEIQKDNSNLHMSRKSLQNQFYVHNIQNRKVDSVETNLDTKEEYGFILDNHGYGLKIKPNNFSFFLTMCEIIQATYDCKRALLLKNPWDFGNIFTIKKLIPSAKFVVIHRNPLHVVSSMWRFIRQEIVSPLPYLMLLSKRYHRLTRSNLRLTFARFIVKRFPTLVARCLIFWAAQQNESYFNSCASLKPSERVDIYYEELCEDPQKTINRIAYELILPSSWEVNVGKIKEQSATIDPVVENQKKFIHHRLAKYYNRF